MPLANVLPKGGGVVDEMPVVSRGCGLLLGVIIPGCVSQLGVSTRCNGKLAPACHGATVVNGLECVATVKGVCLYGLQGEGDDDVGQCFASEEGVGADRLRSLGENDRGEGGATCEDMVGKARNTCGKLDRLQTCAVCKGGASDCGKGIGKLKLGQCGATVEGVVFNGFQRVSKRDACQGGATVKRVASNACDAVGKRDGGQCLTTVERPVGNTRDARGKNDACQRGTTVEGLGRAEVGDAVVENDRGQIRTICERRLSDARDRIGNENGGQSCATEESVASDRRDASVGGDHTVLASDYERLGCRFDQAVPVADVYRVIGMYADGGKRGATAERRIADCRNACGKVDFFDRGAVEERGAADAYERSGERGRRECYAIHEGSLSDGGQGCRKGNGGELRAGFKRAVSKGDDTVGKHDGHKGVAVVEGVVLDANKLCGKLNARDGIAVVKCGDADGANAIGERDRLQRAAVLEDSSTDDRTAVCDDDGICGAVDDLNGDHIGVVVISEIGDVVLDGEDAFNGGVKDLCTNAYDAIGKRESLELLCVLEGTVGNGYDGKLLVGCGDYKVRDRDVGNARYDVARFIGVQPVLEQRRIAARADVVAVRVGNACRGACLIIRTIFADRQLDARLGAGCRFDGVPVDQRVLYGQVSGLLIRAILAGRGLASLRGAGRLLDDGPVDKRMLFGAQINRATLCRGAFAGAQRKDQRQRQSRGDQPFDLFHVLSS